MVIPILLLFSNPTKKLHFYGKRTDFLQLNQLLVRPLKFLNKNDSFLLKYGILVSVLCINYGLKSPAKKHNEPTLTQTEQDYSKNSQKILPLYQLIISIL